MAEIPETREQALYMARLAEKFGRFDEMFELMVRVIQFIPARAQTQTLAEWLTPAEVLTFEERNLFSVASKHVVSGRRNFLLSLSEIERQEQRQEQTNADTMRAIKNYAIMVINELFSFCNRVIGILDSYFIDPAFISTAESEVFYLKMKGDYHRYLAEINVLQATNSAEIAYNLAKEVAERYLDVTHPIRLNLAINFSVFCYYNLDDTERAKEMAEQAFKAANVKVKNSGEEHYRDSLAIMQLLNNHILFWNSAPKRTTREGEQ